MKKKKFTKNQNSNRQKITVITSYKFAKYLRPPGSLSDKEKKIAEKPSSAQPSSTGAYVAVLVAEGGCWP